MKEAPKSYAQSEPAKTVNIIEFDCRGLEFVEFQADVRSTCPSTQSLGMLIRLQGEWQATGIESGTQFTGIDLSEGEWYDYDEKAGEEVSIKDVKWEIRRA